VIGLLELGLVTVVLRRLWRFRRGSLWLVALTSFFFLRGIDRVISAFVDDEPDAVAIVLDGLVVVVLALLIVGIARVARGLELAHDAAEFHTREYSRALVDYRRLARHRIANPLTAIIGSVRTLREVPPTDTETREELLEIIEREAQRLERISLDPTDELAAEERDLRPEPGDEVRNG